MNEKELRAYLAELTTAQKDEMIVNMLENERIMRKELDELKGIIR